MLFDGPDVTASPLTSDPRLLPAKQRSPTTVRGLGVVDILIDAKTPLPYSVAYGQKWENVWNERMRKVSMDLISTGRLTLAAHPASSGQWRSCNIRTPPLEAAIVPSCLPTD